MSEIAPADKIQQLEQRHVQLLDELDALNVRLEEALSSFSKPSATEAEPAGSLQGETVSG